MVAEALLVAQQLPLSATLNMRAAAVVRAMQQPLAEVEVPLGQMEQDAMVVQLTAPYQAELVVAQMD